MSDCVFCQIVDGKAEASTVYVDDTVIAIMTIGPVTPNPPKEGVGLAS